MRRREVIAGLAGAGWPRSASAEQAAVPVIGVLSSRSLADSVEMLVAFRQGLSEVGFFEHQNVAIEYRWADGHYDRLPAFAIPIIFVVGGDPIKFGLVASLSQP